MIQIKFLLNITPQKENLDSNSINRLNIGLLIGLVVLFSYLLNLDKLFLLLLLILITYEFFNMRVVNKYFLIFLFLISFLSIIFFSYHLFENLFFLQLILVIAIISIRKYKKLLFVLILYIFFIILFFINNIDRNIFFLIFLISFFNDTIAYIFGRYLGGPLILPKISPNKTWSGTTVSFFLSSSLLFLLNFNIFISMILSILLFTGDIFFSYIKRFLSIKDFSSLLGSHGGIFDRLDSMFFVTIFLQIYLVYLK